MSPFRQQSVVLEEANFNQKKQILQKNIYKKKYSNGYKYFEECFVFPSLV